MLQKLLQAFERIVMQPYWRLTRSAGKRTNRSGESGGESFFRPIKNFTTYDNTRRYTMFAHLRFGIALVAMICWAVGPMTNSASAGTAELAKKCGALTAKAYPPREVGNPAAGSAKGTGQAERDYFNKCVANGGNPDDPAPKEAK
jgi:hypothetical protein